MNPPPAGESISTRAERVAAGQSPRLDAAGPGGEIWVRWGAITRFLKSSRLAFARERDLWNSLELTGKPDARIKVRDGSFVYSVKLPEHLAALNDERLLYEGVFLLSCALAESAAAERLGVEDQRTLAGVEDWGRRLLSAAGRDWVDVDGGYPGAIEVAVARNAISHGNRRADAKALTRLAKAGSEAWSAGEPVRLDYEAVATYRRRLASLLQTGGL